MGMNSIFLSIKLNYEIHYLPGRNRPSAIETMRRKESIKTKLRNMVVMLLALAIFFLFFFLLGKGKLSFSLLQSTSSKPLLFIAKGPLETSEQSRKHCCQTSKQMPTLLTMNSTAIPQAKFRVFDYYIYGELN